MPRLKWLMLVMPMSSPQRIRMLGFPLAITLLLASLRRWGSGYCCRPRAAVGALGQVTTPFVSSGHSPATLLSALSYPRADDRSLADGWLDGTGEGDLAVAGTRSASEGLRVGRATTLSSTSLLSCSSSLPRK